MPDRRHEPNQIDDETNSRTGDSMARRRLLQLTGMGLVGGSLAGLAGAAGGDLPHTIVLDGSDSDGRAEYAFGVSESVEPHSDVGSFNESSDSIDGTEVSGRVYGGVDAYRFSGGLTSLDVDGQVAVSIDYGEAAPDADQLVIVTPNDADVEYTFTVDGRAEKDLENGSNRAEEGNDDVTDNGDGTYTVSGICGNGSGDTFDVYGDITHFEPVEGTFTLLLNGEEITVPELTGQQAPDDGTDGGSDDGPSAHTLEILTAADESVEYRFKTAGEITKDLDNGDDSAEDGNDAVTDEGDGTWTATGLTGNGYGDTYDFEDDILRFDVLAGNCTLYLDGEEVTPAEINGEEQTLDEAVFRVGFHHDDWLHYRLHVDSKPEGLSSGEDQYFGAGNNDVSQLSDGTWLVDGQTGTSDPSGPMYGDGYRWTPEEGTGVLGWEANPADDLDYYVSINDEEIDPATLPPLDLPEEDDAGVTGDGGDVIGGGSGYSNVVPRSGADYTAASASELRNALGSAGSGDVVYLTSGFDAGSGGFVVPSGVTVAGNRGIDGTSGPLVTIDREPNGVFELRNGARLTGVRLRGPYHGARGVSYSRLSNQSSSGVRIPGDDAEVDNNRISGFGLSSVWIVDGSGNNQIHHNYIFDNNTKGLGYGVVVYGSSSNPQITRNYFNDNRHSIASSGTNYGYVCKYNHFGPRTYHHVIDVHDPGAVETHVQCNIVEPIRRDLDNNLTAAVAGHSQPPRDVLTIEDNWFYQDAGSAFSVADSNVVIRNNHYGPDAPVECTDVIPNHPGTGHTPW